MKKPYLILKFYHYTQIEDPVSFRETHHLYCVANHIRGRIKIASEGINGTISGLAKDCNQYMQHIKKDSRFEDMTFNITSHTTHVHERLHVRLKKEIVHSGLSNSIMPSSHRAGRNYISTATFEQMRHQEDVILLDVRSNYEHKLGKFKKAVTFDIDHFRSFSKKAASFSFDPKKKYIVICTRGIKSEKARDYLQKELKLPHVFHLEGGILDYAQKTDGEAFEGVCYVFDNRLTVPISKKTTMISHCYHCKSLSTRMVNCANPTCNTHVPMCVSCSEKSQGACSPKCQAHPRKRPYNGSGYYVKKGNGYNPFIGLKRTISSTTDTESCM